MLRLEDLYLIMLTALVDIPFYAGTWLLTFVGAMWDGNWKHPYPEKKKRERLEKFIKWFDSPEESKKREELLEALVNREIKRRKDEM